MIRIWCVEWECEVGGWEPVVMCTSYAEACEAKAERACESARHRVREWVRKSDVKGGRK